MEEERLSWQGEDVVLQLLQVVYAHHRLQRLRVAEDEVSEAELVQDDFPQVMVERFRVLVDEHRVALHGIFHVRVL